MTSEGDVMNTAHIGVGLILMAVVGVGQPAVYGQAGAETEDAGMAKGKKLYVKHCAGCHGTEGAGGGYKLLGPDPANLTSPSMKKKSDSALLKTIHEGKSNMPPWNVRLSEQDSRAVLAYIRTLAK
jgi:mono/diheme cytochrome c family protein